MKTKILILLLLLPLAIGSLKNNYLTIIKDSPFQIKYNVVTITTYTINPAKLDTSSIFTASGFQLDSLPKRFKIIAISRDLQKYYKFGDLVKIANAGIYNGIYVVRDLMGNQWRNKIDILINPDDTHTKIFKAKLFKLWNTQKENGIYPTL